ncbi:tRNA (guanosine(37)-N1)-methyltransferase TrmD [Pajaroellobacter abortibovis]|uniref:tRNA (guanine-N(1)-)-methyltransferase n=1 Tax=Pajaroellobacter abortibovis TaxID=1882918 RepID=A0A1L6MWQ3_9BACT|nr:tRNA (guanosine(37)-N1)-methyltransferase TrmD [Pajaroellobacter abortibovis]APR99972.1 tRNA (guanosine(37)-N1)-methyltransferase TrmD [Pajaroellobacter abortibovis]
MLRFDIVTLFPELFSGFLTTSFVGRAIQRGILQIKFQSLRQFGKGRHQSVDDTPYGGGSGMVMRVDTLVEAMEAFDERYTPEERAYRVLLTPQGGLLTQHTVGSLVQKNAIMLICGRYEGFDDRVRDFVDEEISIGDFVMTGGEVAAMTIIEASVRLLPGVLHNADSIRYESHGSESRGLLEYPQFTRPLDFRGKSVPQVLLSGNHQSIEEWRRAESVHRTRTRRPDLWKRYQQRASSLTDKPFSRNRS